MSDVSGGMVAGAGGPLREVDLAKPNRTRRSGSPSEGSWLTPPESDKPVYRRAWLVVCVVLLTILALVVAVLLAF